MLIHMDDNILTASKNELVLTKEQEEICKVIYRKTGDGYLICGFYDPNIPNEDYPDGLAAFPLRSAFGGCIQLTGGSNVYNVVNSSNDSYSGQSGSWLDIWTTAVTNYDLDLDKTNPLPGGQRHNNHTMQSYVNQLPSRTDTSLVGGHICTSRANQDPGEGGSCLLLPIYRYLNSMRESVQMTVIPGGAVALRLINFLK